MKLAIMQPYFFPYLGYFQLIDKVDKFVFYDDVSFIKNGWINRNRILIHGRADFITLPVEKASSNKKINETSISDLPVVWKKKLIEKVRSAYCKAPFFDEIFALFQGVLDEQKNIAVIARNSVTRVLEYLQITKNLVETSSSYNNSYLMGQNRVLDICRIEGATLYINPPGGKELYSQELFLSKGVDLQFIQPELPEYSQGIQGFIAGLSILDVLFYNSIDSARKLLALGKLDV